MDSLGLKPYDTIVELKR